MDESLFSARAVTDPPAVVLVKAHAITGAEWDYGNLVGALYGITLDAIQVPVGKTPPTWRRRLHEWKGFIVDDSPRHLVLDGEVTQEASRDERERGMFLTITPIEGPAACGK